MSYTYFTSKMQTCFGPDDIDVINNLRNTKLSINNARFILERSTTNRIIKMWYLISLELGSKYDRLYGFKYHSIDIESLSVIEKIERWIDILYFWFTEVAEKPQDTTARNILRGIYLEKMVDETFGKIDARFSTRTQNLIRRRLAERLDNMYESDICIEDGEK